VRLPSGPKPMPEELAGVELNWLDIRLGPPESGLGAPTTVFSGGL
jgi:hypothetical protein